MSIRTLKVGAFCSALSALTLTASLHAQERVDEEVNSETLKTTRDGDTIIVTATAYVSDENLSVNKTDIPLIQSPQSVSVISRDQIDLLNFIDVQQAVRYSAGVTGENYGPDLRYDFLTVRGFIPKQYIDGLVAPSTTTIASTGVDLYAFKSVEILKGPVSALYGSTPPGGIYNETSRSASDELGGEIRGKVGTDDYYELAGTITGPVTEGISARVTGLYLNRGAERDFVDAERILVAPTVSIDVGPETKLTVNGYYQKDTVNGDTNGFLPVEGTLLPNPNGPLPRSVNLGDPGNRYERDQYAIGASFSHNFSSDVSLVSSIRYNDYDEKTPQNIYGGGGFTNRTDPSQVNNFFENLAFGYTSLPNPNLGPETSESYEGGIRFTNDAISLSATGFTGNYDNFINQKVVSGSFRPGDPAVFQFVNLDRVKVKGLEGKFEARADNGLTANMAIAYATGDVIAPDGSRTPLSTIDPLKLVMGAGYHAPSGNFGGQVVMTHSARKEARRDPGDCNGPCFRPAAYTILDATAFVRVADSITLRAGIFNITDQKYANYSDVRGLSAASTITDAYTAPGRNASVSLSFKF